MDNWKKDIIIGIGLLIISFSILVYGLLFDSVILTSIGLIISFVFTCGFIGLIKSIKQLIEENK